MSVTIKDDDKVFKKFLSDLKELKSLETIVGPTVEPSKPKKSKDGFDILLYAAANEFGAQITVTDKMRRYLHAIGLHLKKSTTQIEIPERSFMRSTFDKTAVIDKVMKRLQRFLNKMIDGKSNPIDVMGGIGDAMVSEIKSTITSNVAPENAEFTIKQKGTGKGTLFASGSLLKSISRLVKKK